MLLKKKRPTLRASLVPVATLLMGPTVTPPWEGERFQFLRREDAEETTRYDWTITQLGDGPLSDEFLCIKYDQRSECFATGEQTSRHV